jgi:hypothetical protein
MSKFEKGQSGNPAGRKRGTSHADKLRRAIENDLPDIIDAMVSAAKSGDTSASKLLLDRVIPNLKPVQQNVSVNAMEGKTLSDQGASIIAAMGSGNLTPEHAQAMLSALGILGKIREMDVIERRLAALEASQNDD